MTDSSNKKIDPFYSEWKRDIPLTKKELETLHKKVIARQKANPITTEYKTKLLKALRSIGKD